MYTAQKFETLDMMYDTTSHPTFFALILLVALFAGELMAGDLPKLGDKLTDEQTVAFSRLALKGLDQEYPNKPSNVVVDKASVRTPREMHPAFFGCFDWHSALHGHWMLIRILKEYPDLESEDIRQALRYAAWAVEDAIRIPNTSST